MDREPLNSVRLLLLLLLLVQLFNPAVSQCPDGFTETAGTWCHHRKTTEYNIAGGRAYCEGLGPGSKLVDLETLAELQAIMDWYLPSKTKTKTKTFSNPIL